MLQQFEKLNGREVLAAFLFQRACAKPILVRNAVVVLIAEELRLVSRDFLGRHFATVGREGGQSVAIG